MVVAKIGLIALGQSAASDELEAVATSISVPVQVVRDGALDGLDDVKIAMLAPEQGEKPIVCKSLGNSETRVSFAKVFPFMQDAVLRVQRQDVALIAVMCGADWAALESSSLLINPGTIMPHMIVSLTRGKKLGILLPIAEQVRPVEQKFERLGANVVGTYAALCNGARMDAEFKRAGDFFARAQVDLVWMPCMGMNKDMRQLIHTRVDRPVLLANSMLGKIIDEMVG